MPEGSKQAAILIATSFQAMNRAAEGRRDTLVSDATVMILFAGFYLEATLNYIAEATGNAPTMVKLLKKPFPGLQDKLGWFYNSFVAKKKASTRKQLYQWGIEAKLRRKFPGFAELYKFRNDISHGRINKCAASLQTANRLRNNAKSIVAALYTITSKTGHPVSRIPTYQEAIAHFTNVNPTARCS
jgi:hypothetical protein